MCSMVSSGELMQGDVVGRQEQRRDAGLVEGRMIAGCHSTRFQGDGHAELSPGLNGFRCKFGVATHGELGPRAQRVEVHHRNGAGYLVGAHVFGVVPAAEQTLLLRSEEDDLDFERVVSFCDVRGDGQ